MPRRERPIRYNGYTIKWGGWRNHAASIRVIGVWIARPDEGGPYIYATTAGMTGIVTTGGPYDTSVRAPGYDLDLFSAAITRFRAKEQALIAVKGCIDGKRNSDLQQGAPEDTGKSD